MPRLDRSTTTPPSSTSCDPLELAVFSRSCAFFSAFLLPPLLCHLPLPIFSSSPFLSTPPSLFLPNHQLSFILQIKVGRFTGNHLSADSYLVPNSSEKDINIKYNQPQGYPQHFTISVQLKDSFISDIIEHSYYHFVIYKVHELNTQFIIIFN